MIDHPFWKLGFRPFFFFGIIYGLLLILIWVGVQSGLISWYHPVNPIAWHGHEMIYGFATAVIAGFILTASQNWSGVRGVHGRPLIFLVAVWLLARSLSWIAPQTFLYSAVDLSFYPLLAWQLKPHLGIPSQKRNQIFFILFFLMFASNVVFHFADELNFLSPSQSLYFTIHLIVAIVALIAGRVIPFFTQRALNDPPLGVWPNLDRVLVPLTIAYAIAFIVWPEHGAVMGLATVLGFLFSMRWMLWKPWRTLRVPILAVLYVGYLFIPIGFFMSAAVTYWSLNPSLGAHAFGFGVIGIFIHGMMSRVALGHTGRPIRASGLTVAGYFMLIFGALIRVFGSLILPNYWMPIIVAAGMLWIVAYSFLAFEYLPILIAPRLDGAEG